jgi:hypothetical protein
MCESAILVHQKGDPYRTKGMRLRYCWSAAFQAFGGAQSELCFGSKWPSDKHLSAAPQITPRALDRTPEID